jgi:hypothetical protein
MSNPDLDRFCRDYKFRLDPAPRCESCRHVRPFPLAPDGSSLGSDAECRLLDIVIHSVSVSGCPGYQEDFYRRRKAAGGGA